MAGQPPPNSDIDSSRGITARGRYLVLTTAFLGWLCAGTQMSITPLVARSATKDLLETPSEEIVGRWFARYNCAFLLGAAAGGLLLGAVGDRIGRTKAMGASILIFSAFSGLAYFSRSVEELLVIRFLGCLGVGGMWPNGVALVSEAWSDVSRPLLAGIIGTAANVGLVLFGILSIYIPITPESWRWVFLVGAVPAVLGALVLGAVPESPRWLAQRWTPGTGRQSAPAIEVFRPPLLRLTLIGILLGTIPLLGGWGSGNWLVPWADKGGDLKDPALKGWAQVSRSFGGTLGSLAGGWFAGWLGRRRAYFVISLGSLATSAYLYRFVDPTQTAFYIWAVILGVVSGLYFGWLPLCLPELFPTRVRSTGAGVSFNFGRIGAAIGVLGTGTLVEAFKADYGRVGSITSLIYVLGAAIIWLAPDTTDKKLSDEGGRMNAEG